MSLILKEKITGSVAWLGADLTNDRDWFHELTGDEVAALDDVLAAEEGMGLDMMLEPGDLLWANNYKILHSRTGFENGDDPALRRKMLRLMLKIPNARELAPDFPGRNGFPATGEDLTASR